MTGPRPVATSSMLGGELLRLAVRRLRLDGHAARRSTRRLRDLRAGQHLDALLLERLLELRGHGLVLDRHEPRQQLDDRHLAAEAAVDRRELDADGAAAHDDERLRHLLQVDRLVAGDDALVIDLDRRHAARRRAGGDDDLFGLERLRVALEDVDLALAGQARRALDPGRSCSS